jgi:tetratricopeptide (TPR) repeat protein
LYEEAVSLCRGQSDALRLAHTVRHLGDLHQDAGRLGLAEPCYEEALALYRGSGHTPPPLDLANAIRPLAILRERAGNVVEAAGLWREARDLYLAVNVRAGVAECSNHLNQLGD